MPALMGKAKAQQKLLDGLDEHFAKKELLLPPGDFPSVEYRELLSAYNFDRLEKLRPKMVQGVDDMLAYDIPDLLKKFRNPYD
ncbi:EH domain-containing protein 2-like [Miscanthus floridulus]|uniref:EH domain-containing protein 2-like n=1 Tax=Miscanthus floridulus TaxID=154761 RepID=UPI003459CCCE